MSFHNSFGQCVHVDLYLKVMDVSTGVELPCSHCSLYKVPCYHLAMSDNSIRNFCSLLCVLGFQVTQITTNGSFSSQNISNSFIFVETKVVTVLIYLRSCLSVYFRLPCHMSFTVKWPCVVMSMRKIFDFDFDPILLACYSPGQAPPQDPG